MTPHFEELTLISSIELASGGHFSVVVSLNYDTWSPFVHLVGLKST